MFDLILVPLDGSEAAEAALSVAALIPSRRIRLLVVESEVAALTAVCSAERDCWAYLERVAAPQRRQGRAVETVADFGDPPRRIVASAATADLVVMGSRGRGAMDTFLLGSVADWVARHAPVPTMIVRGGKQPAVTLPLTRILVALDGSALAESSLSTARMLASGLGLPIHLVRVVDFDQARASVVAGTAAAKAAAQAQTKTMRVAEEYLAEQVQKLRDRDLIATSETRTGSPASELLAAIREGDVIVLTTRERGGLARWFLGSVAEELVRHAAGPVLLVRAGSQNILDKRSTGEEVPDDQRAPSRRDRDRTAPASRGPAGVPRDWRAVPGAHYLFLP
jgi:nucleotide-binding universal stress UspA family protein